MPPDRLLVHKVVDALRACPWNASVETLAVAAIEAVFEHERCCVCHEPMIGPTICDVCARDKTPVVEVRTDAG
jgi:cytochrome c551/c552